MSTEDDAGTRMPRIVVSTRALTLEDGLPPVPPDSALILLAEVEGEVLCCAHGGRIFKMGLAELPGRVRPAVSGEGAGAAGRHGALGLFLSLLTVGCTALHAVEAGEGGTIRTLGDAFWYGINTISTVGVGDVAPATSAGKLISSAMMVIGNPLYARMGNDLFRGLLGPGGREGCEDLAGRIEQLAAETW